MQPIFKMGLVTLSGLVAVAAIRSPSIEAEGESLVVRADDLAFDLASAPGLPSYGAMSAEMSTMTAEMSAMSSSMRAMDAAMEGMDGAMQGVDALESSVAAQSGLLADAQSTIASQSSLISTLFLASTAVASELGGAVDGADLAALARCVAGAETRYLDDRTCGCTHPAQVYDLVSNACHFTLSADTSFTTIWTELGKASADVVWYFPFENSVEDAVFGNRDPNPVVRDVNNRNGIPDLPSDAFSAGRIGRALDFRTGGGLWMTLQGMDLAALEGSFTFGGWFYLEQDFLWTEQFIATQGSIGDISGALHFQAKGVGGADSPPDPPPESVAFNFGFWGNDLIVGNVVPASTWFHLTLVYDAEASTKAMFVSNKTGSRGKPLARQPGNPAERLYPLMPRLDPRQFS